MPRIYTSANDPLDFCRYCFSKVKAHAFEKYGDVGDGPDGRGNCFDYEAAHPDYGGEDYHCEKCGVILEDGDN